MKTPCHSLCTHNRVKGWFIRVVSQHYVMIYVLKYVLSNIEYSLISTMANDGIKVHKSSGCSYAAKHRGHCIISLIHRSRKCASFFLHIFPFVTPIVLQLGYIIAIFLLKKFIENMMLFYDHGGI